jgi:hypothetical protein
MASIAAEWLRFVSSTNPAEREIYLYVCQAFHDMATHDVDNGTGGLDGSLVYELGRAEVSLCIPESLQNDNDYQQNFGLGFNQTQTDFSTFPNKYVSR